ncbi:MAG: MmgE/PrpD family protein [Hespellia sp.]|nr:MmgE/PrpD family protein [Hespellia sp.]
MVRIQHGYVCADAIKSVALAAKGVEGIKGIYMGEGGLLKNIKHGDLESPDFLTNDLGKRWVWREEITMKPYAGCKYNHTPICGLLNLMKEHAFTWQEIESVHYTVSAGCRCTIEPAEVKWNPQTPAEALFSNPYSVAYAAITGDCFLEAYEADVIKEKMASPEFQDLMPRISYETDPSLPPFDDYPITVTLKDGRTFSKIEDMLPGNVKNPMSWEQIEHKFWNCTRYSAIDLGKEKYEKIIELCKNLEKLEDMNELLNVLTAK